MARKNQNPEYLALRREYVKLAKRADERLVRLEKLAQDPMFKGAKHFAYRWAQKNLKVWSPETEKPRRFNAAIPNNQRSLKKKMRILKQFLDMPTSTKTGIKETFKKKAEDFNELHGTDFTWEQLSTYFHSGLSANADAAFGSSTALELIAEMQRRRDEVIEAIKESNEQTLILTDRKTIAKEVSNFLEKHGTKLLEIL